MFLYRVAYDGTLFHGFTGHPESVETYLKKALGSVAGRGSRTDPGVSAVGNVVLSETGAPLGYINARLPRGVWVWAVAQVPEGFNPKRATRRRYLYVAPHWGEDLSAMREAASLLTGTHDYASFIQRRGEDVPTVTTVEEIRVELKGDLVYIYFTGRGFRNKQLRKMAWAILAAGRGSLSIGRIKSLLERPEPGAVPHAPAEGLILLDIEYRDVEFEIYPAALREAYMYFLRRWRHAVALGAAFKTTGLELLRYEDESL